MIKRAFQALVVLLGILVVAASSAGPGAAGTCKSGATCTCDGPNGCGYTCAGGGCNFVCAGGGGCTFRCPGGGCTVNATGLGAPTLSCPGNGCTLRCNGGGACAITQCTKDCACIKGYPRNVCSNTCKDPSCK
jgi:hypothetical protein